MHSIKITNVEISQKCKLAKRRSKLKVMCGNKIINPLHPHLISGHTCTHVGTINLYMHIS